MTSALGSDPLGGSESVRDLPTLVLRLISKALAETTPHLSVDGMTPRGPNLSHWPGNRTPPSLKADLSTGICLNFARLSPAAQREVLADHGGAQAVLNDHYDTDGFLSLLAVLRPKVALAREELCLAAAATGDYQCWQTERGFAIDRIVAGLLRDPASPLATELAGCDEAQAEFRCYAWLIEHAEQVLDAPESLAELWRPQLEALRAEWARHEFAATVHHDAALAVVHTRHDASRFALNSRAGGAWRVLHIEHTDGGPRFRYHDRTESWFEVATFVPPPRHDLRPLAAALEADDSGRRLDPGAVEPGPTSEGIQWWADAPDQPVPELYFGKPSEQAYGEITRSRSSGTLDPDRVVAAVRSFLTLRPHNPVS